MLRTIAAKLPLTTQQALKRRYFARQLARGSFRAPEPEFDRLAEWVRPGDWVIDVGANIGHYTTRLSALVAAAGRVIAIEPASETFELLASNVSRLRHRNVTLINAAASIQHTCVRMTLPHFDSGMSNYYQASITESGGDFEVMALPVDSLVSSHRISFIKIDVEGHEAQALRGMTGILQRDKPCIVIEGASAEVQALLEGYGYSFEAIKGSPNRIFRPRSAGSS